MNTNGLIREPFAKFVVQRSLFKSVSYLRNFASGSSFCSFCVFVPFVAIFGNDPAAAFCKRLNSSIRLLVFIRVHSWFVFPLCG